MSDAVARVHRYGPEPDRFLELTLRRRRRSCTGGGRRARRLLAAGLRDRAGPTARRRPGRGRLRRGGGRVSPRRGRRRLAGTLEDVAAALDCLPTLPEAARLDLTDVTAIGHSAGGQLAAWLAGRDRLPPGVPGAGPRVRVTRAVLQAGGLDLEAADRQMLGHGAVRAFLGGSAAQVPERYGVADPARLLPSGALVLCVHGAADGVVPVEQSERYAAAAAGDRVELRVVPGTTWP